MMDLDAAHAGFVVAAYLVSFAGLAALVLYILLRDQKLKRRVSALDAKKDGRNGRS